jgi:BirA family biotin operon repressor/biotin-[acetyl-CoA-carboxylase] ligase
MPEPDLDWIAARLTGERLRGPLLYRPCTTSTNDDALELAAGGAAEGTVVTAGEQTRGRGRREKRWFGCPEGSLLCSIILRPGGAQGLSALRDPRAWPQLVTLAGEAVARACAEVTGLPVCTKHPNDIMLHGRKVGGLLLESRAPHYAVLGVGLNVRGTAADLPPELQATAAFLVSPSSPLTLDVVFVAVLNRLDESYALSRSSQ